MNQNIKILREVGFGQAEHPSQCIFTMTFELRNSTTKQKELLYVLWY
jgi:hypothetical protein